MSRNPWSGSVSKMKGDVWELGKMEPQIRQMHSSSRTGKNQPKIDYEAEEDHEP